MELFADFCLEFEAPLSDATGFSGAQAGPLLLLESDLLALVDAFP